MKMAQITDSVIRSEIHALVERHRFDPQRLRFRVCDGIVGISGELVHMGGITALISGSLITSFEHAIARIPGVRLVSMDPDNWRRLSTGGWQQIRAKRPAVLSLTD